MRDRDGELRTLEDNTRTPSGFAYAVAARDAVTATLDAFAPALGVTTPAPIPLEPATVAALRATLWDAAAAIGRGAGADASAGPNVVVLTSGSGSSAFFEHATAARWLAAPLVTLEQLQRRELSPHPQAGVEKAGLVEHLADGVGVVGGRALKDVDANAGQGVDGRLQMHTSLADVRAEPQ